MGKESTMAVRPDRVVTWWGCSCVGKESFRSYRVVMVVRVVWSGGYNCTGMVPTRSPMAVRVARIVLVIRSCGCI